MNDNVVPSKGDIEKRTAQYVALRDKIKALKDEFAEKMKPYEEAKDKLNDWLLNVLNETGAVHIATEAGTVYRIIRTSVSLADSDVFWNYVLNNDEWRLLDRRANVTGVQDHIADKGDLPPGVNLNQYAEAGVRRASKT